MLVYLGPILLYVLKEHVDNQGKFTEEAIDWGEIANNVSFALLQ